MVHQRDTFMTGSQLKSHSHAFPLSAVMGETWGAGAACRGSSRAFCVLGEAMRWEQALQWREALVWATRGGQKRRGVTV